MIRTKGEPGTGDVVQAVTHMRAMNAEGFINGKAVTLENIEQFGREVLEDIHPRDSWRASKAFRSHIAVESAKRCLIESVKLAGGEL